MNGNHFWFIGAKEWERLQRENNNPNPFRYQTFSIPIHKAKQLKPVSHFHADGYLPIVKDCLANPSHCHGLLETFDLLANQYGVGHYLKSLEQQSQALIAGLHNQQIMLLEEQVSYSDYTPVSPTPVKTHMVTIPPEEYIASQMADATNWIEFKIEGAGNEPFTLFNSKTREIITQGQLDASGHTYVEISDQAIFYVDVVFNKTKEYRSWYYTPLDYHGQMLAGSIDAIALSLDTINDIHLGEVVPIAKLYQVLNLSKFFSPNSSGGSKIMPALTENGELIRATSAFITEFYLLDLAGFSYIKPVSQFGQFGKGIAAFGIVNATVTPVMETRISDYLAKDAGLKHAVLDYLSVHPDDSNAEARFKNFLEGLAIGALLEPVFIVFRIIKSTLTRTLTNRLSTRRLYTLKVEKVEVENDIKTGEYLKDLKPTSNNVSDFNLLLNDRNGILSTISKDGILDFKINAVNSTMRGSEMFSQMMNHYGENIKSIRGNWMNLDNSATNKNLGVINILTTQGIPLENAITQTWTAKQAAKYGFTQSEILLNQLKGSPGHYTKIEVLFSKPK